MSTTTRTPGQKLLFAILIAAFLAIPLFTVYLLVYDRQSQSETARSSIAEGWGGPQTLAGPMLVVPYREQVTELVQEGGRQVSRTNMIWRELTLAPERADIRSNLRPERRRRSIYEAVVYEATAAGQARFMLPPDLQRSVSRSIASPLTERSYDSGWRTPADYSDDRPPSGLTVARSRFSPARERRQLAVQVSSRGWTQARCANGRWLCSSASSSAATAI